MPRRKLYNELASASWTAISLKNLLQMPTWHKYFFQPQRKIGDWNNHKPLSDTLMRWNVCSNVVRLSSAAWSGCPFVTSKALFQTDNVNQRSICAIFSFEINSMYFPETFDYKCTKCIFDIVFPRGWLTAKNNTIICRSTYNHRCRSRKYATVLIDEVNCLSFLNSIASFVFIYLSIKCYDQLLFS